MESGIRYVVNNNDKPNSFFLFETRQDFYELLCQCPVLRAN